jgi:HD-GYP domain-containing protein (c-di-GMP phosphodiesterase class II)
VTSLPIVVASSCGVLAAIVALLSWNSRRRLSKEASRLRDTLNHLQSELQKEQGKASRLLGFFSRLQNFGISATGRIPAHEFSEALIDSAASLLRADQIILLKIDKSTLEFSPTAGRGLAPDVLSRLRVRSGEGVLGKAITGLKTVVQNSPIEAAAEDFLKAPYILAPLISQSRAFGLLLIARPQEGPFSSEARDLASALAAQAALTFEDHGYYEDRQILGDQIIHSLTRTIEAKDSYTHGHSDRTSSLVRAVTREMALPEFLTREIESGAVLHDLGKVGIEEVILRKEGPLTPAEYAIMKSHPAIGHRILQPIPFLSHVAAIVLYHQEWYNGAGYPEGLAGEEIPLGARIVQILDAWDAMTSDRPYRKAMPRAAAIAELRRQAGTQFDPKLVELFLRVIDRLEREGIPTTEQKGGTAVAAGLP